MPEALSDSAETRALLEQVQDGNRDALDQLDIIKVVERNYYSGQAMLWAVGTYFPGLGLWKGTPPKPNLTAETGGIFATHTQENNPLLQPQSPRGRVNDLLARCRPPP